MVITMLFSIMSIYLRLAVIKRIDVVIMKSLATGDGLGRNLQDLI